MKSCAKKDMGRVLKVWSEDYRVIGPARQTQGDCIFDDFDEATFTMDYGKPSLPPKGSLFPNSEITFTVSEGEYHENTEREKVLLFGIRACDMMGIRQAANFMARGFDDPFYRARCENVLTVVMACKGPQNETCFCTTMRSGPWAEKGFDLQIFDMGDVYLVEAGSERGEMLMIERFFTEATSDDGERLASLKRESAAKVADVPAVRTAMERLAAGDVDDAVWDYFGGKCIVCGGCAFVCPTCTCFTVYDVVRGPREGERVRAWDACLFAGFTREASGHNPRSSQGLRLKRRHGHKLLDYNAADIQEAVSGCVGCGRCSDYCPVHIGTLEVVKAIAAW